MRVQSSEPFRTQAFVLIFQLSPSDCELDVFCSMYTTHCLSVDSLVICPTKLEGARETVCLPVDVSHSLTISGELSFVYDEVSL